MQEIETVGDLQRALNNYDAGARLRVAVQPGYPMEAIFEGIVGEGRDLWLVVGDHDGYDVPSDIHGHARRGW